MPHEVLFFSSNSSKKIVFRNLCLSVITCIIMVINPFLTLFELENATVNNTDSDFTLLTCIRGNIQTSKGWHIFEWKDGSHQVRIEVKLHRKNLNVSNIIIMLDFSIINNPRFLIFSACMENLNHIQVVGHIISLTSIYNNPSQRDFIPLIMLCQHHNHLEEINSIYSLNMTIRARGKIGPVTRCVVVVTYDVGVCSSIFTRHWIWCITTCTWWCLLLCIYGAWMMISTATSTNMTSIYASARTVY